VLTTTQDKYQEVLSVAEDLCRQDTDWVTFYREVLGIDGIVHKAFPEQERLAHFESSEQFAEILRMVTKLREKRLANADTEPTRVITVRLPKSLHESLQTEAGQKRTSMNKLCISKLLQFIGDDLVPTEPPPSARSRRRQLQRAASAASDGHAPAASDGHAPASPDGHASVLRDGHARSDDVPFPI
jgi:predicted HicB family RNase H-like nuclease